MDTTKSHAFGKDFARPLPAETVQLATAIVVLLVPLCAVNFYLLAICFKRELRRQLSIQLAAIVIVNDAFRAACMAGFLAKIAADGSFAALGARGCEAY